MRQIDIRQMSGGAVFNRFHGLVLLTCALIIIFDGYDLAVAGIALPSIMKGMAVDATRAGMMVSAALFGMMFGNIFFGSLADRIGRPRVVALCIALFSLFTAGAGFARDPFTFSALRFVAGVGIGGVMPNVVAQMTEYSPQRIRSTLTTLMYSGYALGGVLAALLGKGLIESYGWPSVFVVAGLPVLLIPVTLRWFPESIPFLLKRKRVEEVKRILVRIDPAYRPQADDCFELPKQDQGRDARIRHLFQDGRGFSTAMFWIAFALCLFMVYGLSSWLVKLMASAGYSLGSALTFVLVLNLGATVGAIAGGWLADRFHIKFVLIGMYALAAVSITLLGVKMPTSALYVLVAVAGASTIGTQIVNLAYTGLYYPAPIRSTGIGWALGVGRIGAILAPVVIGSLVGMALPLQLNFIAIALPALLAAIAISLIDHRHAAAVTIHPASSDPIGRPQATSQPTIVRT
jgi:AAHS family benzoate transporter-like MFS transporter